MSWLYLPGLVEDCWQADYLAGEPSALSRSTTSASGPCSSDSGMDALSGSRSGTTCEPSTDELGVERWMSLLAQTHANETAELIGPVARLKALEATLCESLPKSGPASFIGKTLPKCVRMRLGVATGSLPPLRLWVMPQRLFRSGRVVWALTTSAGGCSCLPSWPTPTANGWRSGKHSLDLRERTRGGRPFHEEWWWRTGCQVTPEEVEELMGWPIGWTDLKPLEMDKFRQWWSAHGMN